MKMKKNIIYIILGTFIGLLGGYFIFDSNGSKTTIKNRDHKSDSGQMWTCSMHPQIMQAEAGSCPICGMDLIPSEITGDGLAPNQFRMTENALALADVQTTVITGELSEKGKIVLSGKIIVNEETNAIQTAHFSGRVEKLYVNYTGEKINKGQLLASVYSPELVAGQQELLTASKLKKTQPDLYKSVRNKLSLWKLSDTQIEAIENSGKIRNNVQIYADESGIVIEKLVEIGSHLKEGQPMYKIANLGSVWASFDAYENSIANLKKGQPLKIKAKAFIGEEYEANISFINPVLNESTRTIEVRAVLRNNDGKFKPGMFVEGVVELHQNTKKESIVIPKSAVLWTGERSVVYVKPDSTYPIFEMREVMLSDASGDNYVITKGLSVGDEIVTNGTFTVDASAQLKGKKSMMNHNESDANEEIHDLTFETEFYSIITLYDRLKNVLIVSDFIKGKQESKNIMESLEQINSLNIGSDSKIIIETIKNKASLIANAKKIEEQRKYFKELSENIITILSGFKNHEKTLFVQYCPMADDNQGAKWLSFKEKIENPYFTDEMSSCGSIIDSLVKSY